MAINAYILPFPTGNMGFVDANAANLPVQRGRLTVNLYSPETPDEADIAALQARVLEVVASLVRTEGEYAATFWVRLWWLIGGIITVILLALVALDVGLPAIWLTLIATGIALPGGVGPVLRGWRARRLLSRAGRLQEVAVIPGTTRATAERVAALWQVAGRLRGSALEVIDQLESHCLEAQWAGPARLYGHHRLWLEQGDAPAPGLPGLWQRWRRRLLGGSPAVPLMAVPLPTPASGG